MAKKRDTEEVPGDDEQSHSEACHRCGGLCCCLYLRNDEEGRPMHPDWLPALVDRWLARFVASGALTKTGDRYSTGPSGIPPLHDPLLSCREDAVGEEYRASLPEWVDTRKCQFCHPESGCLLPRHRRAPICLEYQCEILTGGAPVGLE